MTDTEIQKYLEDHNGEVNAHDGIMEIFNTSPQIVGYEYDPDTGIMTVITKENKFKFSWVLKHYSSGSADPKRKENENV